MTITKHTDVLRGLTPLNHLTPLDHLSVNRQAAGGGGTAGIFAESDIGDVWYPEDWTTLNQDSGGAGTAVTAASQSVRFAAGQRTNGTNIDINQSNASYELTSISTDGNQGMAGTGADDHLDAVLASSGMPWTIGWKVYVPAAHTTNDFIAALYDSAGSIDGTNDRCADYIDTVEARRMRSQSLNTAGNTVSLGATAYAISEYNSADSNGWLNGTQDITALDLGTDTGFINFSVAGNLGNATGWCRFPIMKLFLINRVLTADERTTLEADLSS